MTDHIDQVRNLVENLRRLQRVSDIERVLASAGASWSEPRYVVFVGSTEEWLMPWDRGTLEQVIKRNASGEPDEPEMYLRYRPGTTRRALTESVRAVQQTLRRESAYLGDQRPTSTAAFELLMALAEEVGQVEGFEAEMSRQLAKAKDHPQL